MNRPRETLTPWLEGPWRAPQIAPPWDKGPLSSSQMYLEDLQPLTAGGVAGGCSGSLHMQEKLSSERWELNSRVIDGCVRKL